ncbi:queuosine precursor transporter [Mariniluteicoccus endophyticus]
MTEEPTPVPPSTQDSPSPLDPPPTSPDRAVFADAGSPRYAYMLATICVVVILSGIGASKGVVLGPVITDGGFFLFPLAYILGDVITEIYGGRAARRAIFAGFAANIASVLCYAAIIALPGFTDDFGVHKQASLEGALGPVWQVVVAGLLGYAGGQSANTLIMLAMKKRTRERGLVARLMSSTGVGELVDTLVFCTVAASAIGISSVGQWANYTFFGFLYKTLVEYAVMPVTIAVIRWIKRHDPSYGTVTEG